MFARPFHKRACAIAALSVLLAAPAMGQATVDDPDANAMQLVTRLDGANLSISNPSIPAANNSDTPQMYGLFSNGVVGAGLEIDSGIVLTTGTVAEALTSNSSNAISQGVTTTFSDTDVTAIDFRANNNVAILEFDVTLDPFVTGLSIDYQFGSDEYPNYVGSTFNDVFAFFVSGPGITGTRNFAQTPLGDDVRINNINVGTVGCQSSGATVELSLSGSYINNGHTTALPFTCEPNPPAGPFPVVTEYNGITRMLTAEQRGLTPGATYRVKFAVADVGDNAYDSGVFIRLINGVFDQDHGDAPASYGNPEHNILTSLLLGTTRTPDPTGYNDPAAAGDIDDGITLGAMTAGQQTIISADISGTGGLLTGWVDWNGNGSFLDPGEQVAADITDGSAADLDGAVNGEIVFLASVPSSATTSQTFARFRISTDAGLAPDGGEASDGEVEDYALTIAPAPVPGACPSGMIIDAQTGYADTVISGGLDPARALGAPEAAGVTGSTSNSARIQFSDPTLRLDMTDLVPAGAAITITLARNNNGADIDINLSDDNTAYTTVGTFNAGPDDVLQTLTVSAPAGGARYIEFDRNGGSTWIAGLEYDQVCIDGAQLDASKSVEIYDPASAGLFALPDNDVIYTITVSNTGGGPVDFNSLELIDKIPSEVAFFTGATPEFGGNAVGWSETGTGLFFNPATDVRFATGTTRPADFASCTYTPVVNDYDPLVTFICLNPKGAMASGDPDPEFAIQFRAQIK